MDRILFRDVAIFDGWSDRLAERQDVLVADGRIAAIGATGAPADGATVIEGGGRTLMPGMIDVHAHIYGAALDIPGLMQAPVTYIAHYATKFLGHALECGFTTIRDLAAGDIGAARALDDGLLVGPRLYYGGRALSQTGGHGDFRNPQQDAIDCCGCGSAHSDLFAVVVDGVDAVIAATREQLRRGASHVKIMASGGVASQSDPLDRCQFSDAEIRAIVDEAERWGAYAAAHCHPDAAVRRCAELGVRTIEHASLIEPETAAIVADREAFAVPTLAVVFAIRDNGRELGFSQTSYDKLLRLADRVVGSLEIMRDAGVRMGFGTDLLGPHFTRQCTEFSIRAQVLKPVEILRSACAIGAEIVGQKDALGCVKVGAEADLLLVDGNPLENIELLAADGAALPVIMSRGRLHRNRLAEPARG